MNAANLQEQCELGQEQLMRTEYLRAETTLAEVAQAAKSSGDFDTLSRVMLPLQEARRQRRQRCGEGEIQLDITFTSKDISNLESSVRKIHQGQWLVAGEASLEPALKVRRIAAEEGLYLDTFLGATFRVKKEIMFVIVPTESVQLPSFEHDSVKDLRRALPANSLLLSEADIPRGAIKGTADTFSFVMILWEKLHAPYLAAADAANNPADKIAACERAIAVDYACELAHQKLADAAKKLSRASLPQC